ncbi:hypothetical protein BaRGS_00031689, partial [Batillaria attramentaria]
PERRPTVGAGPQTVCTDTVTRTDRLNGISLSRRPNLLARFSTEFHSSVPGHLVNGIRKDLVGEGEIVCANPSCLATSTGTGTIPIGAPGLMETQSLLASAVSSPRVVTRWCFNCRRPQPTTLASMTTKINASGLRLTLNYRRIFR